MKATRMHSSIGFTLLEMLLVLTITGLTVVLVPPLFSGLLPTLTLRSEARDVALKLSELRSRAITTTKQTEIYFFADQKRYKLGGTSGEVSFDKKTNLSVEGEPFSSEAGDGTLIRFYPDGSSSGGQIRLANEKNAYRIGVNWLTGLPSFEKEIR